MRDSYFEELYKREYRNVVRYVRRLVRDNRAVEDIVQETFCTAYEKRESLKKHPNVRGWLYAAARNKWLKWNEKQSRYLLECEIAAQEMPDRPGEEEISRYDMVDMIQALAETLTKQEMEILRSYYEYGYTGREMAGRLGITEACFKVRISRLKARLKKEMEKDW